MTRLAPRIAIGVSIVTLVASVVGFAATLMLNAFVLDEYDAYGEVPIPGSSSLHLPEGEVTVNFHTVLTGRPTGGFPIPELRIGIEPPPGVPDPEITESLGGTTTVNSDLHVRVWIVQIPKEGTYTITTEGQVDGYINPRLSFGHDSSRGWLVWLFAGLFVVGLLELFASMWWAARAGKKARPLRPEELMTFNEPASRAAPVHSYTPTDQGVRLEQLRTLKELRDSGALTEEEFEAEKRRILER